MTELHTLTFSQKESACENVFLKGGPFWHLTNPGEEMEVIFTTAEEYTFAVNALALAIGFCGVELLAFAIMSDHIHLILKGPVEKCQAVFNSFKSKVRMYMTRKGRQLDWDPFKCDDPIEITSLEMLRNEIVYVNRNGFVACSDVTPFSYKWSSSAFYFSISEEIAYAASHPAKDISFRSRRLIFKADRVELPGNFRIFDGMVLPSSFCNIAFGKSFFRDANHYFNKLTKAYEAYSETAARLGDKIFLTDIDLYAVAMDKCRKSYGTDSLNLLQPAQKLDLAKILHRQYNASNGQIRRILKLDAAIINELFPDGSSERK